MYLHEKHSAKSKRHFDAATPATSRLSAPSCIHDAHDAALRKDIRIIPKQKNAALLPPIHLCHAGSKSGHPMPVIQRQIFIGQWNLSNLNPQHILYRLYAEGLKDIAAKQYNLDLSDAEFIAYIQQMQQDSAKYKAKSYKDLIPVLCQFIHSKQPGQPIPQLPSGFLFQPFQAEYLSKPVTGIEPGSIYRPSSPVVTGNPSFQQIRTASSMQLSFSTGTARHVGGSGKFMSGVGSYHDLLKVEKPLDTSFVAEISQVLMTGEKSKVQTVNDLHALIVGVEGCARSAHNIALAAIFFHNYPSIQLANPDKSLFRLAETYLTFVQEGGAKKSSSYVENTEELQMLLAHCRANHIPLTEAEIGKHLATLAQFVIEKAGITITVK